MVGVFRHDPKAQQALATLLREPSLYDEFLRFLARSGYPVPQHVLDRDVTHPYRMDPGLVDVFATVYDAPAEHWGVDEAREELVGTDDNLPRWRFRDLEVVTRSS